MTAQLHLDAIDTAEFLAWTRGYDANEKAYGDAGIANACHRAMHGPIMRGYELGVPLLRFADHELDAIPLTMALDRWAPYTLDRCDRCNEGFRAPCRLVMPRGASWVAVHVCFDCKDELDELFGVLVWEVA